MTKFGDKTIRTLLKEVFIIGLIVSSALAIPAYLLLGIEYLISVGAGFAVALLSFIALVFTILNLFNSEKTKAAISGILGILKLGVLGFGLWVLITYELIAPLGFLLGFSGFVIALVIESFRVRKRQFA